MKREMLKELGLTDEAIDRIMAENGRDIEKAKGDIAGKAQELEAANAKISELSEAVKKFDGVDVDGLRGQIDTLRNQYDTDTAKLRLDHAVETALLQAGARNPKAARALLDDKAVKLDGDKLSGLDEQLEALRASDGYLFKDAQEHRGPAVSTGIGHGAAPGADALASFVTSARAAAGLNVTNAQGGLTNG